MINNHLKTLSEDGINKETKLDKEKLTEKLNLTEKLFFEKFEIVFNIQLKLITDDSFNVSKITNLLNINN